MYTLPSFIMNVILCLYSKPDEVLLFLGDIQKLENLDDIPLPKNPDETDEFKSISVLPFSQVNSKYKKNRNQYKKIKN